LKAGGANKPWSVVMALAFRRFRVANPRLGELQKRDVVVP
jgi:hypothetical protein